MTKQEARHIFRSKRKALDRNIRLSLEAKLLVNLRETFDFQNKTTHIYMPIKKQNEPDTLPLIEDSGTWVTSVSDFNVYTLSHRQITSNTSFRNNDYGIPEPVSCPAMDIKCIDQTLVPLIIADLKGHRVGYGKGFYDRFLADCREDCLKIGLSFFEPVDSITDINKTDICLDYLVTPLNTYAF